MTDPTIAALIEADKQRTPGVWYDDEGRIVASLRPDDLIGVGSQRLGDFGCDKAGYCNAVFIAAAANAMPAIVERENQIAFLDHCIESSAKEIERLRAELAECRKDAERYRWLRQRADARMEAGTMFASFDSWVVLSGNYVLDEDGCAPVDHADLDRAIDAALAQQKEQPTHD